MLVTIFLDPVFWLTSDMPISYIRPTSYFSSMFRNDLIILYPDSKNTRQHCNSHSVNHALMGSEGKRMPSKQKWVKHDDMNERPGSLMPWTIISSIGHTAANGASPRRHRGYLSQAEQEEAVTRGHHRPGNQDLCDECDYAMKSWGDTCTCLWTWSTCLQPTAMKSWAETCV